MKTIKTILSAILLSGITIPTAFAENPDTLLRSESPSKVIIKESSEGTFIDIHGVDKNSLQTVVIEYSPESKVSTSQKRKQYNIFNFPYMQKGNNPRKDKWSLSSEGLCVGLTNAIGQTGGGGLQWSKSFEISWLNCLNINYEFSRSKISFGLGFDWRNYKTTLDGKWLVPSGEKEFDWGEAPEGAKTKFSRLKVFSLQLPLLYTWRIPKSDLSLKLGPIACFNTYASIKGVYDDAQGNTHEFFTKSINKRPFSMDFFGSLTYHNTIGVYVRWSPMKVLKDPAPINFNPFTVGIAFLL